jgi:hypothetical protein
MNDVSGNLRAKVITRAGNRCESCRLSQASQEAVFHIDHVVPRVAGGATTLDNLALACVSCSLRKGAKQTAIDPETRQEVGLFNPRSQNWVENFRWDREKDIPLTVQGRATVLLLAMNRSTILEIRQEEMARHRHPPQ